MVCRGFASNRFGYTQVQLQSMHATVRVRHTLACATQPQDEHVLLDRLEPIQLVPPGLWVPLNKGFGQCSQIKLLVSIYSIHWNPCY